MLSEGIYPLQEGQLAALVTHLRHDLFHLPSLPSRPDNAGFIRMRGADAPRYRALFRAVGGPWLWFSRLRLAQAELSALLDDPDIHALRLEIAGRDAGLLELDLQQKNPAELAFFGLTPERLGQGLGRWLLAEALHRARDLGAETLGVHTCSLDHPRALNTYCQAGFRPFRREIEILADPRLDGTLPMEMGGFLPPMIHETRQNQK